jgi:hypothetical protein
LLLAIEKLDVDLIKQLLEQGCNPNDAKDSKTGETCLHLLMYKMCYSRLPDYLNHDEESQLDASKAKPPHGKKHGRNYSRAEIS